MALLRYSYIHKVEGYPDSAQREADRLKDEFVSTEHLLLSIAEGKGLGIGDIED